MSSPMVLQTLPQSIQDLVHARAALRLQKKFDEADLLRKELEELGYVLKDTSSELPEVYDVKTVKDEHNLYSNSQVVSQPTLILFGSGEISPTGGMIHAKAFDRLHKKPVHVVIVSTPAGFQPNVEVVCEEIREFICHSLQNYRPEVEIVYANTRDQANDAQVLQPLQTADYIFMGPGSPTYAVRTLENTLLLQTLVEKAQRGVTLSLASAATAAFSHMTLPVYELYKVGEPLHWKQGLNSISSLFKQVTIVPHWDNTDGGKKTDTSCCYMGRDRFQQLLNLLPAEEEVWGIDEQTAVMIDLQTQTYEVLGKGGLHLYHGKDRL